MAKKNCTCDECGKSFNDLRYLKEHKAAIHEKVKFICSICGWKTSWKTHLRKHWAGKHQVALPKERQCEKCKKSFANCGFNVHNITCKGKNSKENKDQNDETGVFEAEMQAEDQQDLEKKNQNDKVGAEMQTENQPDLQRGINGIKKESSDRSEIAIENVYSINGKNQAKNSQEFVIDLTDDDESKVKEEPKEDDSKSLIRDKLFLCPNCDCKARSEKIIRDHLDFFHKFSHQKQSEKNLKIESV